jgi:hypothetical protein
MTESYEDADPGETVFVSGQGSMSLHAAVRRYVLARENDMAITLFRELGRLPGTFDAVDIERLARLKRFKALSISRR